MCITKVIENENLDNLIQINFFSRFSKSAIEVKFWMRIECNVFCWLKVTSCQNANGFKNKSLLKVYIIADSLSSSI